MSSTGEVATATRCPKCDAEVRDGSLFCYNCGGRVIADTGVETVEKPAAGVTESGMKPAPGLRTARDIRRRERAVDRRPREVVWEAVEAGPDLQLIAVTAGIIIFTVVVVLLVLYIK